MTAPRKSPIQRGGRVLVDGRATMAITASHCLRQTRASIARDPRCAVVRGPSRPARTCRRTRVAIGAASATNSCSLASAATRTRVAAPREPGPRRRVTTPMPSRWPLSRSACAAPPPEAPRAGPRRTRCTGSADTRARRWSADHRRRQVLATGAREVHGHATPAVYLARDSARRMGTLLDGPGRRSAVMRTRS
jgi:hypothetical protein